MFVAQAAGFSGTFFENKTMLSDVITCYDNNPLMNESPNQKPNRRFTPSRKINHDDLFYKVSWGRKFSR
jgi:hypothetical protein